MPYPTGPHHPRDPQREHPSAYFVQDRDNLDEMARLSIQDKMLTGGMGAVLEDAIDPTQLQRVLDVGCGTGGWLIEMAQTFPTIERFVGADVSAKMIAHARTQAKTLGLSSRVQFQTMDALRALDVPDSTFDLVNQRLGVSWLRTWEWTKILLEYQRVSRPGGLIRITESSGFETSSPAQKKLADLALQAGHGSGRFFAASHDGLTRELPRLFTQHGIEDIQIRVYPLVYRAGTESGQYFSEDMASFYRVALPFFQKWTRVPSDYEEIYQQALVEMQQPDFVATMTLLTIWGTTSKKGKHLLMRGLT